MAFKTEQSRLANEQAVAEKTALVESYISSGQINQAQASFLKTLASRSVTDLGILQNEINKSIAQRQAEEAQHPGQEYQGFAASNYNTLGSGTETGYKVFPQTESRFVPRTNEPPAVTMTTPRTLKSPVQTTQPKSVTPSFSLTGGVLKEGTFNNQNVTQLQSILNNLGYNLSSDGDFGPMTKKAVMQFQKEAGITADGIVGPQTVSALNQRLSSAMKLPSSSVPTTAGTFANSSSINNPVLSPYVGDISFASSATEGMKSFIDTQFQIVQDQAKMEQQIRDQISKSQSGKAESSFLQNLLGSKTPSQVEGDAFKQTGIDPKMYFADQKAKIAEIENLSKQYNNVVAQRDQAIAQSHDKLATNRFIDNQIAQIQRNAAPQLNVLSANINAKSATLQALQGNFAEARNFAQEAVRAATADKEYNYEMYRLLKSENEDLFDRISTPYKQAYDLYLDSLLKDYNQTLKDKQQVGELMIDPQLRGAGILITDSLEVALQKAQRVAGPNYLATQNLLHGDGNGTSGGGDVDTFAQAYLNGQIDITSVPQELRASVISTANKLAEEALRQEETATNTISSSGGNSNLQAPGVSPFPLVGAGPLDLTKTIGSFFTNLFR